MKFLLAFCLIAALGAVVLASSASWGTRDYLLLRETVVRNPIRNSAQNVYLNYPTVKKYIYENITNVRVFDNFKNTTGAVPALLSGGPSFNYVNLILRGKANYGMNSTVEVYGYRR